MKRGILAFLGTGVETATVHDTARRAGLVAAGDIAGMALFAGSHLPVRPLKDGSFVLGDIFAREGGDSDAAGEPWGSYLRFWADDRTVRIERAPLTGLPLYWMRFGAGILCFSHLELAQGLVHGLDIDHDFVAHSISYINLRTERTGLRGLSELLPGSRLEIEGGSVRLVSTWSPRDYAARPTSFAAADLAPRLERCVIECVRAWGGARPEIMLELSGGLDSSIVAAALAGAGCASAAINFVTPRGDGDERRFARVVASRCGASLVEADLGDEVADLVAPPHRLTPRPADYAVLGSIDRAFDRACGPSDAAIFGGIGGDNIFGFDGSVAPILDAAAAHGYSRRTFEALRDVARAADTTMWHALRLALRARRKGVRRGWRRETLFLDSAALPEQPFAHPWDEGMKGAAPAKRNHVEAVMRILDFVDRPGRWYDRDVVAPLLSQPLVEFCLAIPSWTWVEGGRDRAVARAAFASRLPPAVVWRRGKGRIESVAAAAYRAQRADLRDLLLGGRLAALGLLDRVAIEIYLARDLAAGDYDYYRLLEIADVERWVRALEVSSFCGPSRAHRAY